MALQLHDCADDLRHGEYVADSPARHGVGLRHRAGNDDVALEIGMRRDGERLSPVVEKVRVALIRQQEDVALAAQLRDAAEFIVIKDGAARIIRRIHHDDARPGRERAREDFSRQPESVGLLRGHKDRIGIHEAGDVAKGHPVGRGNNHIVAFVHDGGENIEERVLAAEIHDALGDIVLRAEIARMLVHDGFLELFDSADRRIFREIVLNGSDAGLLHIVGRGEIGLTRAEVHHIDALLPQLLGGFHHRHRLRY